MAHFICEVQGVDVALGRSEARFERRFLWLCLSLSIPALLPQLGLILSWGLSIGQCSSLPSCLVTLTKECVFPKKPDRKVLGEPWPGLIPRSPEIPTPKQKRKWTNGLGPSPGSSACVFGLTLQCLLGSVDCFTQGTERLQEAEARTPLGNWLALQYSRVLY